jgi:hypothetical protein
MTTPDRPTLAGVESIIGLVGSWPSFHDAEILKIVLSRSGASIIEIDRHPGTDALTPARRVQFKLWRLREVRIENFNQQNVIFELRIDESDGVRIDFVPCFGVEGFVSAEEAEVSILD